MPSEFASDTPLDDPSEDRLGRAGFASRVAEALASRSDPASLVVAIYGAWGEGKTTVLRFIERRLAEDRSVSVVKFNPWRYGDEVALLRSLFASLASARGGKLTKQREDLFRVISNLSSVATPLSAWGLSGEKIYSAAKSASEAAIEELRGRLEEILDETGQRVVVLLDDLDRLEPAEIHAVLRLVKLTADFRHVSYVLACDEEVVAEGLARHLGNMDPAWGRGFLHKIVQVPLTLPLADPAALQELFLEGLNRAIRVSGVTLSNPEEREVGAALGTSILPMVRNMRQCKRLENTLTFALPLLSGEARMGDLILLEAMRALFPDLYRFVRNNSTVVVSRVSDAAGRRDEIVRERSDAVKGVLDKLSGEERECAEVLVRRLFPNTDRLFPRGTIYGADFGERWSREKRVCADDYFERYFTYSVTRNDVSDAAVEFVIDAAAQDGADMVTELQKLLEHGKAVRAIGRLRRYMDQLSEVQARNVAMGIAAGGVELMDQGRPWPGLGALSQCGMLVAALCDRVPTRVGRDKIVLELMKATKWLPLAGEILRWTQASKDEEEEKHSMSAKGEIRAKKALVTRIKALSKARGILTMYGTDGVPLLWRVHEVDGRAEVGRLVREELANGPDAVVELLRGLAAHGFGAEGALGPSFDGSQLRELEKLLDPTAIDKHLRKHYAPTIAGSEDDERSERREMNDDVRLLRSYASARSKGPGASRRGPVRAVKKEGPV